MLGDAEDATRLVDLAVGSGAIRGRADDPDTGDLARVMNTMRKADANTYSPLEPYMLVGFGPERTESLSASIFARQAEAALAAGDDARARRLWTLARKRDPTNLDVRRVGKQLQ